MRRRSDLHALAGAYAMDAVPEPDRAAFERHLASCEPCRQEVRGLREATAALAAATAVQPSAAFREAALRAAGQTRQFPPATAAPPPGGRRRQGRGLRGPPAAAAGGPGWAWRWPAPWPACWPWRRSSPGSPRTGCTADSIKTRVTIMRWRWCWRPRRQDDERPGGHRRLRHRGHVPSRACTGVHSR